MCLWQEQGGSASAVIWQKKTIISTADYLIDEGDGHDWLFYGISGKRMRMQLA